MTKIFVYAANKEQAEQAVQTLKSAGAEHVEVLESLKISTRQPKENRYLFICETPAEKLATLAPQVLTENDCAQELGTWYSDAIATIAAFSTQKKRAIIISHSQLNNLNTFIELINDKWSLSLKSNAGSDAQEPISHGGQLLAYLVQNLVNQTPELLSLSDEIAKLLGTEHETIYETDALSAYRGINRIINQLNFEKQALLDAEAELKRQINVSTGEADLLLKQLHTLQEAAEKQKAVLTKENAKLTLAKDTQAKAAKDSSEEAELLLNQLHQVQEELEHYFIQYKEAELQRERQQTRWQKILACYPDYIAFEAIQLTPKESGSNTLIWSITGLENAHLNRPHLEFETFIEAGVLGFCFHQDVSGERSSLKQWPKFAKDLKVLECIPVGKGEAKAMRAKTLKALSGSDWQLIQLLPKLIEQAHREGAISLNDQQSVFEALHKFSRWILHIPQTLRYDAVILKNNQVNPDYEHLWFEYENLSFGDRFWPKFEIRLGAANIEPNGFSMHPKIEIPLIDGKTKPFESWFEESMDDFGPKFEIRFDTVKKIYDTGTWGKLNVEDMNLVRMLARSLPSSIKHLDTVNISKKRSLQEWSSLTDVFTEVLG